MLAIHDRSTLTWIELSILSPENKRSITIDASLLRDVPENIRLVDEERGIAYVCNHIAPLQYSLGFIPFLKFLADNLDLYHAAAANDLSATDYLKNTDAWLACHQRFYKKYPLSTVVPIIDRILFRKTEPYAAEISLFFRPFVVGQQFRAPPDEQAARFRVLLRTRQLSRR